MIIKNYVLYENTQQAKKYLKDNNINLDHKEDYKYIYDKIVEVLKKNPNYIGMFVKFVFDGMINDNIAPLPLGEITDKYYDSFNGLYHYITAHKDLLKRFLPKDIIKYDTFEELTDDITKVQDDIYVSKFMKKLYTQLRRDIDTTNDITRSIIVKFMKLPDAKQAEMSPLKHYKMNNKSGNDYINDIKTLVEKSDPKNSIRKDVESFGDKIKTVYDENNILIIRTFDKEAIGKLGAQKWCIVYATSSYWDTYCNPLQGYTQYILFDFNKSDDDPKSIYGISLNNKGEAIGGGCQDKLNQPHILSEIIEELSIPLDIIISYEYTGDEMKKAFGEEYLLKRGYGNKYLTSDDINGLNLSLRDKVKYKLYDYITKEDVDNVDSTKEKLKELRWTDGLNTIKDSLTDDELYALDFKYKCAWNASDYINLLDYVTEEEKAEFKAKDTMYKIKFGYDHNGIRFLRNLITDDELKALSVDYKLKNTYINFIDLKDFITGDEFSNFTWYQKYMYKGEFTDEELEIVKKLPLHERLKIDDITDEIITEKELESSDDVDIEIDSDADMVLKSSSDIYENPLVNVFWDNSYDVEEVYNFVNSSNSEIELNDEEDYVHVYLNDTAIGKMKNIMELFGYDTTDIEEEGCINKFFEENEDYLKYDSVYNSKGVPLTVHDILAEISEQIEKEYSNNKSKVYNDALEYDFEYNGGFKITIPNDVVVDYARKCEEEINDIDDFISIIDDVETAIEKYNTKNGFTKEDKDAYIEYKSLEDCKHSTDIDYTKVIEMMDGVIKYVEENIDELAPNVKKYLNIVNELGIDDNIITQGDIEIKVLDRNFDDDKIKISRKNTKTNKEEDGWIKIDNLPNHINNSLFESNLITIFENYIMKKPTD